MDYSDDYFHNDHYRDTNSSKKTDLYDLFFVFGDSRDGFYGYLD